MKSFFYCLSKYIYEEYPHFKHHLADKQELEAYDGIYTQLNEKQRTAFNRFEELYAARQFEYENEIYELGFRMGIKLFFELFAEEIFSHQTQNLPSE